MVCLPLDFLLLKCNRSSTKSVALLPRTKPRLNGEWSTYEATGCHSFLRSCSFSASKTDDSDDCSVRDP